MVTRIDSGIPFLINTDQKIVGYVDNNGRELDMGGNAITPGTSPVPNTASYAYDASGNVTGLVGPGGTVVSIGVSVAQFGGTGSGTETTAFTSACAAAVTVGHKRVFIPFATFTVTAGTDCQGCEIYGAGTALTGRVINHAGLINVKVLGINQSLSTKSPAIRGDNTPKILWRSSATVDYCIVQKARGYALIGAVINSTTTTNSLATTTSDVTRRRFSEVLDAIWAGVYKHTFSAESGTWTTSAVGQPSNVVPTYTSGRALTSRYTTTNGDYAEYVLYPKNGRIQFSLFSGTTASETAEVKINGVAVATIVPVAAASNTIRSFTIPATGFPDTQTVTVRITHTGTNGKRLQIIGANFRELKDWDGEEYTHFAYFRNSAWVDYLTQSSANDAVINEFVSGKYGVSYHGGETSIVSDWYVDHVINSPAADGFVVSRDIYHANSCDVSWAAFGGGSISIKAKLIPKFGGLTHAFQMHGGLIATECYSHMFGAPESFTDVIEPVYTDLTASADGSRNPLGRSSNITMRNPTTKQEIRAHFSLYDREQIAYGGAHVWKVVGSYNKMYYGPCILGKMQITELSGVSDYVFA